jgi:tetratricopeptide (TPR) repeat protein
MVYRTLGLLLFFCLLVGCSSAPKRQPEVIDSRNRAAEYSEFGNTAYGQGDYEGALRFFQLSLAHNAVADDRLGLSDSYNSIGKVYLAQGKDGDAERHFAQAYRIAEDAGDAALMAKSRNNQGEVSYGRGEFQVAMELFQEALETGGGSLEDPDRAVILHNLGSASRRLEQTTEAEDYYQKALAVNTREEYWAEAASNYYMLASLYLENGRGQEALEMAQGALESDRKVENGPGIAKDYLALGRIATALGDPTRGLDYYERSVFVLRSLEVVRPKQADPALLVTAIKRVIEVAKTLGDTEAVARYTELLQDAEG